MCNLSSPLKIIRATTSSPGVAGDSGSTTVGDVAGIVILSLASLMMEDQRSPPCLHSAPACSEIRFKVFTNASACLQLLQSKMQPDSSAHLPLNLAAAGLP
jgi:hypothetical protein